MSSNSIYQWRPRYYYIFRNKTSEKLYMGQTVQSLEKYLGSGVYWVNHCKAHGGYNCNNIELVWSRFFLIQSQAQLFLDDFEKMNPEYWNSDLWANLVKETTDISPFSGNMKKIFEKHGNPFTGGKIQKDAHERGCYSNIDYKELGYISWERCDPNRRQEASERMSNVKKKWIRENYEYFLQQQKEKAQLSKYARATKIKYNDKIYYGWKELKDMTGVSKYMFKKYSMGEIINE